MNEKLKNLGIFSLYFEFICFKIGLNLVKLLSLPFCCESEQDKFLKSSNISQGNKLSIEIIKINQLGHNILEK